MLRPGGAATVIGMIPVGTKIELHGVDFLRERRIQGSMSSLISLAGIFAPALFAGAFGFFIGPHAPVRLPGVAFLIASLLLAIAAFVAWRFTDSAHLPAKAVSDEKPVVEPAA